MRFSWKSQKIYVLVFLILLAVCIYMNPFSKRVSSKHTSVQRPLHPSLVHMPKLMVSFQGRTGNNMFCYASLLGISRRNNLLPLIPPNNMLFDIFALPMNTGSLKDLGEYKTHNVKIAAAYDSGTESLGRESTYMDGYLQSWKYFENVREELVKKHFVLHEDVSREADAFLQRAMAEKNKEGATLVGVHVRRGDFVRQRSKGFTAAPVSYYYKAMNYFRRKYANVLFIMISNDVTWAEDHLDKGPDVFYSHNSPDQFVLDLAVLIKCNHSIISSGTFSWWVGYLTGGEVVYYHLYPEPGTLIARLMVREDYYPKGWVPL